MTPTLQLLDRHRDELSLTPVSWFDTPLPSNLIDSDDRVFNLNWAPDNQFSSESTGLATSPLNVLHYPKAKDRLAWWLDRLQKTLQPGQRLWIVGENNGGIKSLPKRLPHWEVTKLDSARHCSLFEVTNNTDQPSAEEQWTTFSWQDLTGYALPGVFSAGRLDKGTEVLLSTLPEFHGELLEFGAGSGILTSALAKQPSVRRVDAVEIDLLAVRSANRTVQENQLTNKAFIHWSDGLESLPAQRYDALVSNPPFHQGLRTAYAATEKLFAQAHLWLKPGGQFIWVINDFLNYQMHLDSAFSAPETLVRERGFKVQKVTLR
ncbi:class I SAM-dependent methyltransferase [Reinekea blandensis]|uniref:16S RNA G1207 methylase RsmC n=1 Tax=Reinekea blandensis MED297 TaxID=314283 RepID=A4BC00_9GAMM|nr:class I SAM-dependent methyltransferase [Reinekea blandensis]EAR10485.1 16S RNA G1207 methylase RsmC [Reinekea sp. MED297] [Reinekea blandensis MED297]